MIYYHCPDWATKSGGTRRLYRHVEILTKNGFPSAILHQKSNFRIPDMPEVPICCFEDKISLSRNDVIVIPEGYPDIMFKLKDLPIRRFAISLSWTYIFDTLPDNLDWRDFNIEGVITVVPFIADMISWSMDLPVHVVDFAIDPKLYYFQQNEKVVQISFSKRKSNSIIDPLKRILRSRNPQFIEQIIWNEFDNLSEEKYAEELRKSMIYLTLSTAEGLNKSVLEAMRSGTVVVGFDAVGQHGNMIGTGEKQNCVLAQNGDYISVAYLLEPLLNNMITGDVKDWQKIIRNARRLTANHTPESEERSIINLWENLL